MITMAARIAVATALRRAIISSGVRALKGCLTTFSSNDKKDGSSGRAGGSRRRYRQHHSEQLGATISNPSAFKMFLPMRRQQPDVRERDLKPRPVPAYQARNSTEAKWRLCRPAHGHSIEPRSLIAGFVKSANQGALATVG